MAEEHVAEALDIYNATLDYETETHRCSTPRQRWALAYQNARELAGGRHDDENGGWASIDQGWLCVCGQWQAAVCCPNCQQSPPQGCVSDACFCRDVEEDEFDGLIDPYDREWEGV